MMDVSNRPTSGRTAARRLATLALVAAAASVLADRERHPIGDRAVLVGVVAGLGTLHLRDRRLVAAALAFACASWVANAEPPEMAARGVRALAALRVPSPDARPPADFVDRTKRDAAAARFEEECRLYDFAILNLAAFLALWAASPLLRRDGGGPSGEGARG